VALGLQTRTKMKRARKPRIWKRVGEDVAASVRGRGNSKNHARTVDEHLEQLLGDSRGKKSQYVPDPKN